MSSEVMSYPFHSRKEDLAAGVINTALKSVQHAREGRLPILGSDLSQFVLYCNNAGPKGLLDFEWTSEAKPWVKGRVLVWRDYYGDVSDVQAERLFAKLMENEGDLETQDPVLYDNGVTYMFIQHNNVYMMIAARQNCL